MDEVDVVQPIRYRGAEPVIPDLHRHPKIAAEEAARELSSLTARGKVSWHVRSREDEEEVGGGPYGGGVGEVDAGGGGEAVRTPFTLAI